MANKKEAPKKPGEPKVYGDPIYGPQEDIYAHQKKLSLDDEGNIEKQEAANPLNEGSGLDVPGGELDDQQEAYGNEDEENNYYSLGGDNHHAQEEENEDDIIEDDIDAEDK